MSHAETWLARQFRHGILSPITYEQRTGRLPINTLPG